MAKAKLSRGLDAIFGEDLSSAIEDIQQGKNNHYTTKSELDINSIRANPYQPRKAFNQEKINELAQSIELHGVFQPILVRKAVSGYELVAGERRLRASKKAKLTTIPAIVIEFTEEQMMEISLLENIQRENLSIIEEAIAFQKLINNLNYTQEELAKRVGKSRAHVTNILRLLKLPSSVQELVQQERLSMGHVKPLLVLEDENQIYDIAMEIIDKELSVREVEKLIKDFKHKDDSIPGKRQDPKLTYVQNVMTNKLQTKVEITNKKISISYSDIDDLNRILELINCIEE